MRVDYLIVIKVLCMHVVNEYWMRWVADNNYVSSYEHSNLPAEAHSAGHSTFQASRRLPILDLSALILVEDT